MNRIALLVAATVALGLVAGCSLLHRLDKEGDYIVAADPLDRGAIKGDLDKSNFTNPTPKDKILAYLSQSQRKCSEFVSNLVLHHTVSDTALDIGTTAATAAATAITAPLSAIHALTATGAVTSGTKTALDSDFFAKASVANFAQAVQSTYYKSLDGYIVQIKDATSLDPSVEYLNIERIHSLCALGPAEASIAASLQPSPSPDNTTVEFDITVSGDSAKDTGTVTVTGSSASIPGIPPASVSFKATDKATDIAKLLADRIATVITAAQPTITAAISKDKPNVVAITSHKADAITWTVTPPKANSGITVSGASAPVAGAPQATAEFDITVSGTTAAQADTINVTATSPKITNIPLVSVKVEPQQKGDDIASALAKAFTSAVTSVQPTITATVAKGKSNVVVVTSPAADAVKWQITQSNQQGSGITVTGSTLSTAGAAEFEQKGQIPSGPTPPAISPSPTVHVLPGLRIQ